MYSLDFFAERSLHAGEVVGFWEDGAVLPDGGTYVYDGTMHNIGALTSPGSSTAYDVNNNNQVVGVSTLVGDAEQHAFLWQNGKMTDLYRNYYMYHATDVNDAGQIVGASRGGGAVSRGPVLLTPTTQRTASSSLTTASTGTTTVWLYSTRPDQTEVGIGGAWSR